MSAVIDDPSRLGLESGTFESLFGKMHYVTAPKQNSEDVVLFLHGFGSTWKIWTPLIAAARKQHLLKRHDILLVDLPSFGRSENQLDHLRAVEIGQELCRLAAELGYKRIHVVGHSMGGFLALDMAANQPQIISVRVAAGAYFTLLKVVNNPMSNIAKAPLAAAFYGFQYFFAQHARTTRIVNSIYKRVRPQFASIYVMGGKSFQYASQNGLKYDAQAVWGSITIPTHGVFGAKDVLVSKKDMHELQEVIPHAKLHMISDTGHALLIEKPEDVARTLLAGLN